MTRFKPPIHDVLGLTLVRVGLPLALLHQRLRVEVSPECLEIMHRLRSERVAIFANHSDRHDPLAVFAFAQECGEQFNYMTARELFDMNHGFRGWVLQRCGSYSVVRGEIDHESIEMTQSILMKGQRKLVMFPEGEVSGADTEISKVKLGPVRIAFDAQSAVLAENEHQPVFILPIGIHYTLGSDAERRLKTALQRMEKALNLPVNAERSIEDQLQAVIEKLLSNLQIELQVSPSSGSQSERLVHFCRTVIRNIADRNDTTIDTSQDVPSELHELRGKLEQNPDNNGYSIAILNQMQRLLILASTLNQEFSLDAAWRITDRLEKEILGAVSRKSSRVAHISAARPVSLLDHIDDYRRDPNLTVKSTAQSLKDAINGVLEKHALGSG